MLDFLLLVNKNVKKLKYFRFSVNEKKNNNNKLLKKYTTGRNFARQEIFQKPAILLIYNSVADRSHKLNWS